jgi:16S rRNA processing protein RimM
VLRGHTGQTETGERVKLFIAGKITGFFGLKGHMKVQPTSSDPERMASLREVFVGATEESAQKRAVEDVIIRQGTVLLKLAGVDDRTAAEKLRQCFLYVEESRAQRPPDGAYFVHDIVGCEVRDTEGTLIGKVESVQKYPAQDLWSIATPTGSFLLPAVKEFVKKVDLKRRTVTVWLMEGLREQQSGGKRS